MGVLIRATVRHEPNALTVRMHIAHVSPSLYHDSACHEHADIVETSGGTFVAETMPAQPRIVKLTPRPLTAETFAEFGAVVGPDKLVLTSTEFPFFTNMATLPPENQPIRHINRHHDHQQIFCSVGGRPMIVIVASPKLSAADLRIEDIQAFITDGNTAIVFHIDTWHLEPRAAGSESMRALNVQAINNHVHTERIELAPTYGVTLTV